MEESKLITGGGSCFGIQANIIDRSPKSGGNGLGVREEQAPTLTKSDKHAVMHIIYDTTQVTSPENGSNPQPEDPCHPCHPLVKNGHVPLLVEVEPIAFMQNQVGDVITGRNAPNILVADNEDGNDRVVDTLTVGSNQTTGRLGDIALHNKVLVRRLTPKECGRLQGFPDGYLEQVPGYSDSKAYAAFGNSMTAQVMAWIGGRIDKVDKLMKEIEAKRIVAPNDQRSVAAGAQ